MIQNKNVVAMDYGTSANLIGWADMDAVFRAVTGTAQATPVAPGRLFDASNVDETGTPPSLAKGYGSSASWQETFKKLWGAS
jgi:ribose transport system substrate-binding protein